jgi:hypothetical protein
VSVVAVPDISAACHGDESILSVSSSVFIRRYLAGEIPTAPMGAGEGIASAVGQQWKGDDQQERIAWDATTRGGPSLSLSLSLSSRLANAAQERETRRDENKISSVFLPLRREKKSDERERE